MEVYPRPDGTIYICGIGGSDYIGKDELREGAFRVQCDANEARVKAAMASFKEMSLTYKQNGELERSQACMRPCPPDAMPYMGAIPGYKGAFMNAGHNCWYEHFLLSRITKMQYHLFLTIQWSFCLGNHCSMSIDILHLLLYYLGELLGPQPADSHCQN